MEDIQGFALQRAHNEQYSMTHDFVDLWDYADAEFDWLEDNVIGYILKYAG